MRILVLCGLLFSLLGTTLSAQAIPEIELREQPPLKSLHYCQDAEGNVKAQNEECGPGKSEVSSIYTVRNGRVVHAPLGETLETWNPDARPGASAARPDMPAAQGALVQSAYHEVLYFQIAPLLLVSLIVSAIAARCGRSGVLTFLVCVLGGFLLNTMITAAGEGVSTTAAVVGSLAVPGIMLIRSLAGDR
jgi:hypothetical protein